MGSIEAPLNTSKGCGAVMRSAPVGLTRHRNPWGDDVFDLGCRIGALTHGHPSGYVPPGSWHT